MGHIADGDRRRPNVWAHQRFHHADGSRPVLYAWLLLEAGLAPCAAYEEAVRLATGARRFIDISAHLGAGDALVKVEGEPDEEQVTSFVQATLGSGLVEKMQPSNAESHLSPGYVRIANVRIRRCRRWPTEEHTRSPAPRSAARRLPFSPVIRARGIACWRLSLARSAARGAAGCRT